MGQELGFFHQEGLGFLVGGVAGGVVDQIGIKGPGLFRASPIVLEAGDGILDARARVCDRFIFGDLTFSGIEIYKQATDVVTLFAEVALLQVFVGAGGRIGHTALGVSLGFHRSH